MTIVDLVAMAERIHNSEGYNIGASSTRDYRNHYWARVVGCAHHGHPVYNPVPDPQWHIKKASPSSPQSDDVCVSLPSRQAWDCIPGAGADGYRFEADAIGVLPPSQVVYAPPVPAGSGPVNPPQPPHVCPGPPLVYDYPDENGAGKAFQVRVKQAYTDANRPFPDPNDQDAFRHFMRFGFSSRSMPANEAADKHISELRAQLGV